MSALQRPILMTTLFMLSLACSTISSKVVAGTQRTPADAGSKLASTVFAQQTSKLISLQSPESEEALKELLARIKPERNGMKSHEQLAVDEFLRLQKNVVARGVQKGSLKEIAGLEAYVTLTSNGMADVSFIKRYKAVEKDCAAPSAPDITLSGSIGFSCTPAGTDCRITWSTLQSASVTWTQRVCELERGGNSSSGNSPN